MLFLKIIVYKILPRGEGGGGGEAGLWAAHGLYVVL